jgi:type II secretory ATPase GspE/PulE/Tfp pilus assembly ATPase PilB-like protein
VRDGMQPMRKSAIRKVVAGITTSDEVARVLFAEDE